ncbi:MAG: hypothetical protein SFU25_10650, partial [Candidatus Caenarcaniphilales bacterium]|nr:hypothetical protein [Candidatus Caenarcaniphilales bacterium]
STGEVMGIDTNFGAAFAKGQIAAGQNILQSRTVFLSVNDWEKDHRLINIAKTFDELNFLIYTTEGTYKFLKDNGIKSTLVRKAKEGEPNILNLLAERKVSLLINIPRGKEALEDNMSMRRLAILLDMSLITTLAGAEATAEAMKSLHAGASKNSETGLNIKTLQEYHAEYQTSLKQLDGDLIKG